jgi:hypothetical protein
MECGGRRGPYHGLLWGTASAQVTWVVSEVLHTVCFLFLKINLFYKIHLQTFNVISIVLYHSGPTFGKVLYSCLNAFVVDASDYSGHLIRHLLNASEAFYKVHLQVFSVISIVIYHSDLTFGHVLYSCLDAFVVDASDYSGRLIIDTS